MNNPISQYIDEVLPEVRALRHDLHAHPELAFKEFETSRKVRECLAKLPGIQIEAPIMETDVVAVLNADCPGPCLAIRADLDALPIAEEVDAEKVPYRSTVPGVMHACGHDGHTATLVGTAMVLSRMASELSGKVKFIFQPGEEQGGGAETLCARGVMDGVDGIVALHGWPTQPVGSIALRYGFAMACNDCFFITVHGQGSHGAYPHRGLDPIVVAAHIVTALQSIVSRTVDPVDSVVVTVGAIHAGTATNVIPPACEMKGTLRYLRFDTRDQVLERFRRIVEHTAQAHGTTADLRFEKGYPSVVNEEGMCRLVEQTGRDVCGPDRVITTEPPSMGVEDFSYYGKHAPSCMFRVGVRPPGMDTYPPLHNARFNFNDDALPVGMHMFCEVAHRFLTHPPVKS